MSDKTPLTPSEIAELRQKEAAATKGPWRKRYADRVTTADDADGTGSIAHFYQLNECESNAELVAVLRNAAAHMRRQAERIKELDEQLDTTLRQFWLKSNRVAELEKLVREAMPVMSFAGRWLSAARDAVGEVSL